MVAKTPTSKDDKDLRPPTAGGGGGGGGGAPPPPPPADPRGNSTLPPALAPDIPAPPSPYDYYPDQLILYGIKLNPDESAAKLSFGDDRELRLEVYGPANPPAAPPPRPLPKEPVSHKRVSIAAVYGYSFEGHCYRLDKPRMFIIEDAGMDANGCGFAPPYYMWSIRARTSLMEISLSYDLAEVLILDANLPGNRSPNTYGNDMMLAHRSGKLNRPGGG